ncbi:hypothetical protein DPMN_054871 [Dreissena polymorpha]|uniref:Uncharacterized protein n=1 Tax=Dreissena polymorpha TaxID=45954 RepID=A0A9D4HTH8_DREPO|nr:hypothetical protein DPMN_054871 [Dreissena polymorpha]
MQESLCTSSPTERATECDPWALFKTSSNRGCLAAAPPEASGRLNSLARCPRVSTFEP